MVLIHTALVRCSKECPRPEMKVENQLIVFVEEIQTDAGNGEQEHGEQSK